MYEFKSLPTIAAMLLAASLLSGSGCVSEDEAVEDTQSNAVVLDDTVVKAFPASASSQAAYGVVSWRVEIEDNGADTHILGIKANGRAGYDAWTWESSNGRWWNYTSADVQFGYRTDGSDYYVTPMNQPWKFEHDEDLLADFQADFDHYWHNAPVGAIFSFFGAAGAAAGAGAVCGVTGGLACPEAIAGAGTAYLGFMSAWESSKQTCSGGQG